MSQIAGATHSSDGVPKQRTPVSIKVSIGRPGNKGGGAPSKLFRFVFQRRNEDGEWTDDPKLMKAMTEKYGKEYRAGKGLWIRNFKATLLGGRVDQIIKSKGMLFRQNHLVCSTDGFKYYKTKLEEMTNIPDITLEMLKEKADTVPAFKQALADIKAITIESNVTEEAVFGSWSATRVSEDKSRRPFPCTGYDCPWQSGSQSAPRACAFVGEFYFRLPDVYEDGIAVFRTSSMEIIQSFQETLLNARNMTDILTGVDVDVMGSVKKKQFGDGTTKVFTVAIQLPGSKYVDVVKNVRSTSNELKALMGEIGYKDYVNKIMETNIEFDLGVTEEQTHEEIKNEFAPGDDVGEKLAEKLKGDQPVESTEPIKSMKPTEEETQAEEEKEDRSAEALFGLTTEEIAEFHKGIKKEDFDALVADLWLFHLRRRNELVTRLKADGKISRKLYNATRKWVTEQLHTA